MGEHDPKPPGHLSRQMRAFWRRICADFVMEAHHLVVLEQLCTAVDRATAARALIDEEGLVVVTPQGSKRAHPAVSVERDCRVAIARLARELRLDDVAELDVRPPRGRGRG